MGETSTTSSSSASGSASRVWERRLSIGTWVLTGVHLVWFYFYVKERAGTGDAEASMMSFGTWWEFCKTWPGGVTAVLAMVSSIAQTVLVLRTPLPRGDGKG